MRRFAVSPYLLLVLTTLFWSGNFVLARFVRLEVPPVGLSFWRWVFAAVLLLPFVWQDMRRHWPLVRANLKLVLALALFGVASFNTLIYLGLQTTTASNAVLLDAAGDHPALSPAAPDQHYCHAGLRYPGLPWGGIDHRNSR